MSRERLEGAIEALEKISSNPGFPTLAANLVELWIKWTHEAISALPPDPASVESTLAAVARDDAERTIERMHGPAKPDPRDEVLERAEKALKTARDAFQVEVRRWHQMDEFLSAAFMVERDKEDDALAAIRAAKGGK